MPRRILLVDDDRHSREGLCDALTHGGFLVETAADSWQAIQKARAGRFAVAIVDLDLPPIHGVRVAGWDLVRILQTYSPRIAIILVAAENAIELKARADLLGVAELLEKPISPGHVQAIVTALDRGHDESCASLVTWAPGPGHSRPCPPAP